LVVASPCGRFVAIPTLVLVKKLSTKQFVRIIGFEDQC
jgi:hypothetical protein